MLLVKNREESLIKFLLTVKTFVAINYPKRAYAFIAITANKVKIAGIK